MAEYTNGGDFITSVWMPTDDNLQGAEKSGSFADGYGYDTRIAATQCTGDVFVHRLEQLHDEFGQDDGRCRGHEALRQHRCHLGPAFPKAQEDPRCAGCTPRNPLRLGFSLQLLLHDHRPHLQGLVDLEDEAGEWQAKAVADIGDANKIPLPVDISISADDNHLWINTGTTD